jgi:protoheme IX farnesyltransferase
LSEAIVIPDSLPGATAWHRIHAYWDLTKPRIAGMVLVAAMVGFYVSGAAASGAATWLRFLAALTGIGLVGAGANALNQYLESDFDAQMARTRERPIPSGRLTPFEVLAFGVGISVAGLSLLLIWVNPLSTLLTALTIVSYVLVYTPLKRITSLCVYVGAVPGALPPVIGWAAGCGTLAPEAWLLFAILYFWQLPHFAAIAWQYREDYADAGYPMLSVGDRFGFRTCRHLLTHTVALLMASLLPALTDMTGATYAVAAMLLGTAFLLCGARFALLRSTVSARGVVIASVLYLPLLFITLMLDKTPVG